MIPRNFDFLIDAQLPLALAKAISAAGSPARHVSEAGLLRAADIAIWDFVCQQGCALVTKDEDFVSIRQRSKTGSTIVWLRLRNSSSRSLIAWFMPRSPEIIALIHSGEPLIELR